jgi:hypothetical protein
MKAVVFDHFGAPDVLQYTDVPLPNPARATSGSASARPA